MENLDKKLCLIETVIEYLDKSKNLAHILKACQKHCEKKNSVLYIFKILLDPSLIHELNADLGNLVLFKPAEATQLFQEVVFQIVTELGLLKNCTDLSQISVQLRLKSLPNIPHMFNVSHICQLTKKLDYTKYIFLRGIVTGCTAASKYTHSTRYLCPIVDCEGNTGNYFIRVHFPGASEAQTIRNDFECTFCGTILNEEKPYRQLEDRIVAEIVPEEAFEFQTLTTKIRHQAIPVCIRGDLTRVIDIGQAYDIIGLIRKEQAAERVFITIEANNIVKTGSHNLPKQLGTNHLSTNIRKLYTDRCTSPWGFSLSLAYVFGESLCPAGTYFKLKLILLLSILSIFPDKEKTTCKPLHVLAIGQETPIIHRLMWYAQKYCTRCCPYNSANSLTGTVKQDKYNTASYFVQGGALLLATDGVCYMGDISRFNKSSLEQVQSVLNNGKVAIVVSAKFTAGLPHKLEGNLGCLVWANTDPLTNKKPQNNDDLFLGCNSGTVRKSILDGFSIVHFTDSQDSYHAEEALLKCSMHCMTSSMAPECQYQYALSDEDFVTLIDVASPLTPVMSKEADTLIQNYYLASRKARNGTDTCFPSTALQTLYSLCVGHCRLCLRSEIEVCDALIAIKLYEESITARFGYSLLCVQNMPHIPHGEEEIYLGKENDSSMEEFHRNLLNFCATHKGLEE